MKTKIICFVFLILVLLLTSQTPAFADEKASASSANFAAILQAQGQDNRVKALQRYLEANDSPLAPYAEVYVAQADINNIPWDLLVAITGTESSLGKAQPCNNSYGFGVYGDQTRCFESITDGIKTVSKALREQYIDQWHCKNIDDIGALYASSSAWSDHTKYFMQQIESFKTIYDAQTLPISF